RSSNASFATPSFRSTSRRPARRSSRRSCIASRVRTTRRAPGRTCSSRTSTTSRGASLSHLLEVEGVTLQYKTRDRLVTAAYRVGFEVQPGDRFVLLGPSGCGKSTLLKAVGGFIEPVEGVMRLNGRPIRGPGPDRVMVFQEFDQLFPWKTVLENVMYPLRIRARKSRAEAEARALALLEKVHLAKSRDAF